MKKNTFLVSDSPVSQDAFGGHTRIAEEINRVISIEDDGKQNVPHAVALLGSWGSGKSSVIRMLKAMRDGLHCSPEKSQLFLYDAWSHEGDGLRRAFLDALTQQYDALFNEEQRKSFKSSIWDEHEHTMTTTESMLRPHGRILFVAVLASPLALSFFNSYPDAWPKEWSSVWSVIALLIACIPLALMVLFAIAKKILPLSVNRRIFGVTRQEELEALRLTSFFFQRVEGQVDHKWTTSPIDSTRHFKNTFREICDAILQHSDRLVIVIDNIDRLDGEQARLFWSTMQSFCDRSGWSIDKVMR